MSVKFSQLRELARQYSSGQLAHDEYRSKRTGLLDSIAAGRTVVDYREITLPKPSAQPTVLIDVGEDEPESRRLTIILGAIAVVVAIGAAGWFVLRMQTATPTPIVNVAPKDPAIAALEEFLVSDDWSSAGIAAFEARWDAFDETQRQLAEQDGAFGRLENELRSRLDDQLAVAADDHSGKAAAEAAKLRAFAARLQIKTP